MANATKPKRDKKEAFKIDFFVAPEKDLKETAKELFAPVTRGARINLPGTSAANAKSKKRSKKSKEKKDDHRLPDDMHFTSRQLVTLFLKPKFSVCGSFNSGDELNGEYYLSLRCEDNASGLMKTVTAKWTKTSGPKRPQTKRPAEKKATRVC
jgi:Condensin complex subunit 2